MRSLFPIIRAVLFVALFVLLIAFAVQNSKEIRVDLFHYEAFLSVSLLISLTFGGGIIIGVLVMTVPLFKLRWQLHKSQRQIRRFEKQSSERSSSEAWPNAEPDARQLRSGQRSSPSNQDPSSN